MLKMTRRALMAAVATMPLMAYAANAEGLISIIVTDPANPYWFTEGEVAKKTAEDMGYSANVAAHKGDTNVESQLIDTAITNKSVAIILDPANADGSVGAVQKAVDAGIPVILVNAEVNPDRLIEQTYAAPSVGTTMAAVSSAQFSNYNMETLDRFRQLLAEVQQYSEQNKLSRKIYFTQVSFEHVKSSEINRLLNSLPTTLALEDIDVDRLIVAGRLLLRTEPEFEAFKQRHNASLAEGALSEQALCEYYPHPACPTPPNRAGSP